MFFGSESQRYSACAGPGPEKTGSDTRPAERPVTCPLVDNGPFAKGADIDYLPIAELSAVQTHSNAVGQTVGLTFKPADGKVTLHVTHSGKAFLADLTEGGKPLLPPTKFSSFDFVFRYVLEAYTADSNLDGRADFAIYAYSGGCGLASGYCDIAFVLSAGEKYTLLEFDQDKIKLANQAHPDFPKTVFYTLRPNHSETTIITEQQKAQMLQRSLESIFWKEQEN